MSFPNLSKKKKKKKKETHKKKNTKNEHNGQVLNSLTRQRMAGQEKGEKRRLDETEKDEDDDEWIGPLPSEAAKPKKKKGGLFLWISIRDFASRLK